MSDKRQFAIVMLIATFFVGWVLLANISVMFLNSKIKADPEISKYPYPFRVLRKEGTTAIMSTLRSETVSATLAIKILFPELKDEPSNSYIIEKKLKKMAYLQAKAKTIVLSDNKFNVVGWELDTNWYRLNGINLEKTSFK